MFDMINMINTKAMTNKMTQDKGGNPYKRVVLNNVYKVPEKWPGNEKLVYI